jgi:outer membrane receptor protein involved in Fe transport
MRISKKQLLNFILFLFLTAFQVKAQNGKISGKVMDKKTGEELIGVTVVIEGTSFGAATDYEGKFTISNVKPGTYNLIASYVSYGKKQIQGVEVKANEITSLSIILERATKELVEVVVQGTLKRENSSALLLQQKKNISISDGISADMIRKTPDATTGDVMKRVSGTSIQDNKFAVIRGLNDRYNTAYINGAPLPSTESDKKAFSFDIIPSNMLDNMVITKSGSADLPGDFAGGMITINTKDIPEKSFYSVGFSLSSHSITTGQTGYTYNGGKTDWLGFDDGTRKYPAGLPGRLDYEKSTAQEKYNNSLKFNDDWETVKIDKIPVNFSINAAGGNSYKLGSKKNNEFGFTLSASYNNSNRNTSVDRITVNKPFTSTNVNELVSSNLDEVYKNEVLGGLMANFGLKLGTNHKISFKNAFTINTEDQTILRGGIDPYQDVSLPKLRNTYYFYQQNQLLTSQLIGDHFIKSAKLKINWVLNNNIISRQIPDFRRFKSSSSLNDPGNSEERFNYRASLSNQIDISQTGRFYSELDESITSANLNFQLPAAFLSSKSIKTDLKFGGMYQNRQRDFQARAMGYKINTNVLPQSNPFYELPLDEIFLKEKIKQDTFFIDERINPQDVYKAYSNLGAAYLMLDQRILSRIRMSYGLRFETYRQVLESKDQTNNDIKIDTTFTDLLPSINFTYELTDKTNLRASYFRSLARPEFRELAPFQFYDFNYNTVVSGNTALARTRINNYDLRFEYFPGEGQLMSASLFYKTFENAIEQVYENVGSTQLGYTSNASATNYGIELELRKNFDFLDAAFKTEFLRKFSFTINYAYIISEVKLDPSISPAQIGTRPLQGQSPYILNTSFQFFDPKSNFSAAIFLNRVGRRIAFVREKNGTAPDLFENPRTVIDISMSKKLFKGLDAKFVIGDLLHQDLVFYQDNNDNKKYDKYDYKTLIDPEVVGTPDSGKRDNTIFKYKMGMTLSFGLNYKF